MQYRPLGDSGILVSEIGFGAWGIGGLVRDSIAYGPTDDAMSQRAVQAAFDAGVTFYDTAALYGYGHSEELLGRTLHSVRDRVVFSTKAGYVDFSGKQDFSPHGLRSSLEDSLHRLKTEYIDVFQLHDPPIALLEQDDAIMTTLEKMRQEGLIRVVGISTRSPAEGLVAVQRLGFKSVQVNFNLVDQRARELDLFAACRAGGAGIIVRTPLCFGFLTGKYAAGDVNVAGDHRQKWEQRQIELWTKASSLFCAELGGETVQSKAQLALRFVLSFDEVSTTIPGMLTEEHVAENIPAGDLGPLPSHVIAAAAEIYKQNSFFCRKHPGLK